jgi:hypothetical protein
MQLVMDNDKLNAAAEDCLRGAISAELPFIAIRDCIGKLIPLGSPNAGYP